MKRIEPLKPIELRMVLEVEPYHWSERPVPDIGPAHKHSQVWDSYFHACMADAGIRGIRPIRPGSSFVDAFLVLENELILRMIRELLADTGLPGFPDEEGREHPAGTEMVSNLKGGYAVPAQGDDLFAPQCCCEFSDLENWKHILVDRPANCLMWIGHPPVEVRFDGDIVTVREGWEAPQPPESPELLVWFSASATELSEAVSRAEVSRSRFATGLVERVRELVPDVELATKVTARLMGDC